jgi:hypothetical protein
MSEPTASLAKTPHAMIDTVIAFLREIGLEVIETSLGTDSFLPGVEIMANGLRVDRERLDSVGDLLHEAGHLALMSPAERAQAAAVVNSDGGYEMGAIAWSYAAALHVALPINVLFHDGGYRGSALTMRENFNAGRYIGVPMLQWRGLAARVEEMGVKGYPAMVRWLAL